MDEYSLNKSIKFKREGKKVVLYSDDHLLESFELYEDVIDYLKEKLNPHSFLKNLKVMEREDFFKGVTRCSLDRNEIIDAIEIILKNRDGKENYLENYNTAEIDLLESFFEYIYKFRVDESEWKYIKIEREEGYDEQERENYEKEFGEKFSYYLNRLYWKPAIIIGKKKVNIPNFKKSGSILQAMINLKSKIKAMREEKFEPTSWFYIKNQIEQFRNGFDKFQYNILNKITEYNVEDLLEYGWKDLIQISSDFDVKNIEDIDLIKSILYLLEQKGVATSKNSNGKKVWKKK